jgi:hypothetical protein
MADTQTQTSTAATPEAAVAKAAAAPAQAAAKVVKAATDPAPTKTRKPRAAKAARPARAAKPAARKVGRPAKRAAAATAGTATRTTTRIQNEGTRIMKKETAQVADRLQAVFGDVNERARTQIERNTRIAEQFTDGRLHQDRRQGPRDRRPGRRRI